MVFTRRSRLRNFGEKLGRAQLAQDGWMSIRKGDDLSPEYLPDWWLRREERQKGRFICCSPSPGGEEVADVNRSYRGDWIHGDRLRGDRLEFIDVRRAYFYAKARRLVYVRLPVEDREDGMRGRLVKAMYGTRNADQN